ncbi:MAG TPA: hypothetical protein VNV25_20105 [Gemmatimonadaceae bacterium]|nr:hypothetical protein [Gemmatimonadaceae bacterium]
MIDNLEFFIRWIYSIPVSWPEAIALAFGICISGEGVHLRYLYARAPRSEKTTNVHPWVFWLVIGALVVGALIVRR